MLITCSKKLLIALCSLCLIAQASATKHSESSVSTWLADSLIKRYQPTIDVLTHHGWDHSNSIVMHALEKVYQNNKNQTYLNYIKKYADDYINPDGSISGLLRTLDGMHPGVICLFLYEETGEEKYRIAAKVMRDHLLGTDYLTSAFNKTPDGAYWHKNNAKYKNVISVDGLYMKDPFLVRYGIMFNEPKTVDLAINQVLLVAERSFNIRTNLPFHAWSYDKDRAWADPITGQATQHWSRASGWFAMALVDILEHLPKSHKQYRPLQAMFERLASGLQNTQNPKNGLWYQVLDAYTQTDNYPEVSGTGMIVYALKKGSALGLIDKSYANIAQKGREGMQTYINNHTDGGPIIHSIAPGMSSKVDYKEYVSVKPISVPSPGKKQYSHGYIGVLMAASEMEKGH